MNNCKKLGLMACLLAVTGLAAGGCAYAAENNSIPAVKAPEPPAFEMVYGRAVGKVIVGIDLNHEVLYTILQLTDYAEKLRNGELKPIAAAVLNDLKQYKKHPAVIELEAGGRLNWANRFSFGYVTHFPQHFTSLPEGKRIYEYSDDFLERVLHGMPKDEKIKYLDAYWEKVKDFYKTAEYEEFFKRNSALYKSDVDSVYAHLPRFDFAKLHEDYHGNHDVGNFYLVPSQLNLPPGGSYGGPMSRSVFNYMGHGFDNSETIKFLILHEFGHSFCNPVVEKYLAEVGKYASLMKGL
ncbi:MAG: DUF4932 domain-containing protein, partial [Elusimicrobiota bacterium]|nr:DUF4932 domain-containing protein [Elusimicrobiota bacterium]